MVAAFVQNVGAVGASTSGTTLQLTISGLAAAVAVGNRVIVSAIGGGAAPSSCVDSQSNSYSLDASGPNVDPRVAFLSAPITTALNNGDTITVTYAASTASRAFRVTEYSGLDTTPFDKSASSSGSAGTAADSTATATLTQADELVVGAVGHVSTVGSFAFESLSPAWNHLGSIASTGTVRTIQPGYRVVSATTAVACKATWTTSRNWSALVATYKAAAAQTDLPRRRMSSYLPH